MIEDNTALEHLNGGRAEADISQQIRTEKTLEYNKKLEEIKQEPNQDPLFGNVSIESATYMENTSQTEDDVVNFEVDSIELATPELHSNDLESNLLNQENSEEDLKVFENSNPEKENEIKEPEMFEESNSEEDFEIPAFLRRQKN